MKAKVLVYFLSLLVGSSASAAGDLICEAGIFSSKTYLIVDQGIHVPRDIEEKTNIVVVGDSGSTAFKVGKLEWKSIDDDTDAANVPLSNLKHTGHLEIEYTYPYVPKFPPNHCKRCVGDTFGYLPSWDATLTLDGKQTVFTCKSEGL